MVGELGAAIIKDTLWRVRAGDRLWYENIFPDIILDEIKATTLADIISRNTEITNLPENVFLVPSN